MIPYYSPNFGILDLLRTLGSRHSVAKLEDYFRDLTGKSHVMITSSCRSALFLAYRSMGRQGIVHVSPLTCQVALLPVMASGNTLKFHDVKMDDWTLDPVAVENGIRADSLAIQAIHLGGFPCDMSSLRSIADSKSLVLIEDCAQGFGALLDGRRVGTWGDISCFTLTKNVFGLGGGVFATDNLEYYQRAVEMQETFAQESKIKLIHRIISALLGSRRENALIDTAYQRLTRAKKSYISKVQEAAEDALAKQLRTPAGIYSGSVASRIKKISRLNKTRHDLAQQIIKTLEPLGFVFQFSDLAFSSYTKLFCMHPKINSESFIRKLNAAGIEAMHLEHKLGVHYQPKMTLALKNMNDESLINYEKIHDCIVSIPLYEKINTQTLGKIKTIIERNMF